jgi:hypothetical protein
MQDTTKSYFMHMAQVRVHFLVVLSFLLLALLGRLPESSAGWVTCPPQMATMMAARRCASCCEAQGAGDHSHGGSRWRWVLSTWRIPLVRSLALLGLWLTSGWWGPGWVIGMPWLLWLWQSGGSLWPWLRR